jgi:hypothetical protein
MRTATWGLPMLLAAITSLSISFSPAEAKHEQLGRYRAVQADYRTGSGKRIPFCLRVQREPVTWRVTNSKGEIIISGKQGTSSRCSE